MREYISGMLFCRISVTAMFSHGGVRLRLATRAGVARRIGAGTKDGERGNNIRRDQNIRYNSGRWTRTPLVPWLDVAPGRHETSVVRRAESTHGPKEGWHCIADPVLRRELLGLLVDYLREVDSLTRKATSHANLLRKAVLARHREFSVWIQAVASNPSLLAAWDPDKRPWFEGLAAYEKRRVELAARSGAPPQLPVSTSTAASDERIDPGTGERLRHPWEVLPFLRQRAAEMPETLSPELLQYATARWGPATADTAQAPRLAAPVMPSIESWDADSIETSAFLGSNTETAALPQLPPPTASRPNKGHKASSVLFARPKDYFRRTRLNFDAEGAFFEVRRGKGDGPKKVKMATVGANSSAQDVVKIDWKTIRAARRGVLERRQRARERMVRLCRGEDPATVPPLN